MLYYNKTLHLHTRHHTLRAQKCISVFMSTHIENVPLSANPVRNVNVFWGRAWLKIATECAYEENVSKPRSLFCETAGTRALVRRDSFTLWPHTAIPVALFSQFARATRLSHVYSLYTDYDLFGHFHTWQLVTARCLENLWTPGDIATSKFCAPQRWHETSSKLGTHKCFAPP
jgi:hypothetical protein